MALKITITQKEFISDCIDYCNNNGFEETTFQGEVVSLLHPTDYLEPNRIFKRYKPRFLELYKKHT